MTPIKSLLIAAAVTLATGGSSSVHAQVDQNDRPAPLEPVDGDLHPDASTQSPVPEEKTLPTLQEPDGDLYPEPDEEQRSETPSVVHPLNDKSAKE